MPTKKTTNANLKPVEKSPYELSAELMFSEDYKERFKAEYIQLKTRLEKLGSMLQAYAIDELTFEPACPFDMLRQQYITMVDYLGILEQRAEIEGVTL